MEGLYMEWNDDDDNDGYDKGKIHHIQYTYIRRVLRHKKWMHVCVRKIERKVQRKHWNIPSNNGCSKFLVFSMCFFCARERASFLFLFDYKICLPIQLWTNLCFNTWHRNYSIHRHCVTDKCTFLSLVSCAYMFLFFSLSFLFNWNSAVIFHWWIKIYGRPLTMCNQAVGWFDCAWTLNGVLKSSYFKSTCCIPCIEMVFHQYESSYANPAMILCWTVCDIPNIRMAYCQCECVHDFQDAFDDQISDCSKCTQVFDQVFRALG